MSPPPSIRATFVDEPVVDTTRAVLVWEPRRIVPSYAVPAEDVAGDLSPSQATRENGDAIDGERAERPRTFWS